MYNFQKRSSTSYNAHTGVSPHNLVLVKRSCTRAAYSMCYIIVITASSTMPYSALEMHICILNDHITSSTNGCGTVTNLLQPEDWAAGFPGGLSPGYTGRDIGIRRLHLRDRGSPPLYCDMCIPIGIGLLAMFIPSGKVQAETKFCWTRILCSQQRPSEWTEAVQ